MTREDILRVMRNFLGPESEEWSVNEELMEEWLPFLQALVAAEREECAKVCEGMEESNLQLRYEYRRVVLNCADAIRARGNK